MISFFRNFRKLKTAYLLNIAGLSVAFAAFFIIITQVRHELEFDKHTQDFDRIYRLENINSEDWGMGKAGEASPIFTRLWVNEIISSSPLVEAGSAVINFQTGTYCTVEVPIYSNYSGSSDNSKKSSTQSESVEPSQNSTEISAEVSTSAKNKENKSASSQNNKESSQDASIKRDNRGADKAEAASVKTDNNDASYSMTSTEVKGSKESITSVDPSFTKIFTFDILEGNADCLQKPDYALISESMAKRLFPESASAIGKEITIKEWVYDNGNRKFTVGGVYRDFHDSQLKNVIYLPLEGKIDNNGFWSRFNYQVYIKLINNDQETADAFLDNYYENFIKKDEQMSTFDIRMTSLHDIYFTNDCRYDEYQEHGKLSSTLILLSIGILILILAIINFTNFSMALVPFRIKGINTKKVLGCSNVALQKELIVDAVWTSIISAILALVIVAVISRTDLADMVSTSIAIGRNWDLTITLLLLSIAVGFFAGIYPSRYTTSYSPALVLKGSFGLSPKGLRLRRVLVAFQFVISMSLIACSLLIQQQNRLMQTGDLGFPTKNLYISSMNSDVSPEKRDVLASRIRTLPEVKNVSFASDLICAKDNYQRNTLNTDGRECPLTMFIGSWDFAKTLGLPFLEGEYPSESQRANAFFYPNQAAQEAYGWSTENNFGLKDENNKNRIQGITPNIKIFSLKKNPDESAIVEYGKCPPSYIYVRAENGTDPKRVITEIESILKDFDPAYPFSLIPFEETLRTRFREDAIFEKGVKAFSFLAIVISIIGVFGLILFDTQQKRRDIAVRRVHGAETSEILLYFTKPYLILLGICWALSIPIVIYVGRTWLATFANKVAIGPGIFLAALAIILTITMITIIAQVLRAVRNNPVDSIKIE